MRCPFDEARLECIHDAIVCDFMWRFSTNNCRVILVFGDDANSSRNIWPAGFTRFSPCFDRSWYEGKSSSEAVKKLRNWIRSDTSRETRGKILFWVICVGDGECVSCSFQLPRASLNPSLRSLFSPSYSILLSTLSRRSPCAKSLSCILPFFEYNLQTPLNARSRFKPPRNRRAPFVPGCKDFAEGPPERVCHPLS